MINAFSQVGNIAGSYVWSLPANGYRGSYAITLAMFGATILGWNPPSSRGPRELK